MSNQPPQTDAKIQQRTGRDWAQWCAFLDARDAATLSHPEIAALVRPEHAAGGWWTQAVTVGYERLRGLRVVGQRRDASFDATASKTLPLANAQVHVFFSDARQRRRWLSAPGLSLTSATAPRAVRMRWSDGTPVAVWIEPKGEAKCSVAVEHGKLTSAEQAAAQKLFWRAALERLAALVAVA